MDTRSRFHLAALLAVALAGACSLDDGAAASGFARQAFRATTLLIRAVVPPPPPVSMTTGVRG